MAERHDELTRQALLSDLEAFVDRLIIAISTGNPRAMATFADLVAVRYRKRKIAMDDIVTLCEGLRRVAAAVVEPSAYAALDASIDAGDRGLQVASAPCRRRAQAQPAARVHLQGRLT